jgi:hypothetical protein
MVAGLKQQRLGADVAHVEGGEHDHALAMLGMDARRRGHPAGLR